MCIIRSLRFSEKKSFFPTIDEVSFVMARQIAFCDVISRVIFNVFLISFSFYTWAQFACECTRSWLLKPDTACRSLRLLAKMGESVGIKPVNSVSFLPSVVKSKYHIYNSIPTLKLYAWLVFQYVRQVTVISHKNVMTPVGVSSVWSL
jgi:hypothetical protein